MFISSNLRHFPSEFELCGFGKPALQASAIVKLGAAIEEAMKAPPAFVVSGSPQRTQADPRLVKHVQKRMRPEDYSVASSRSGLGRQVSIKGKNKLYSRHHLDHRLGIVKWR